MATENSQALTLRRHGQNGEYDGAELILRFGNAYRLLFDNES